MTVANAASTVTYFRLLLVVLLISVVYNSLPQKKDISQCQLSEFKYTSIKEVNVVHVTKEFGISVFGGLGRTVTDLAQATKSKYPSSNVAVITPLYSYIQIPTIQQTFEVTVTIDNAPFTTDIHQTEVDGITIYYVTSCNKHSQLGLAFKAKGAFDIYYTDPALPAEVQDLYFNLVASAVLQYLSHKQPSLAVHIHGSTNAPTMMFYNRLHAQDLNFVYSVHDYTYEPKHTLKVSNVYRFIGSEVESISYSSVWHPSEYGIKHADHIVIASQTMANDLFSGKLQGLMVQQLALRCSSIAAISNGVSSLNPQLTQNTLDIARERAKRQILSKYKLTKLDGAYELPIVLLYVGRFSKDKGMVDVHQISNFIRESQYNVLLIVMGSQNDYQIEKIGRHDRLIIIQDETEQKQVGDIARYAADIAIVPSRNELFGLVAVEALQRGSFIFSTGVGGLKEFLNDKNSFVYSQLPEDFDQLLTRFSSFDLLTLRQQLQDSVKHLEWSNSQSLTKYMQLYSDFA